MGTQDWMLMDWTTIWGAGSEWSWAVLGRPDSSSVFEDAAEEEEEPMVVVKGRRRAAEA